MCYGLVTEAAGARPHPTSILRVCVLPPSSRRHVAAAFVVLLASFVGSVAWAPAAAAAPTSAEKQMATWVNDYRIAHGKPPLPIHSGMSDDARAWSSRMASTGLSHDPHFSKSCDRFPGWDRCRENVGYAPTARTVQDNFQRSTGHRANLLCDCTHIGIGIVSSGGRVWVTQRMVHDGKSAVPPMRAYMTSTQVTAAQKFIRAAYVDFLRRWPSTGELDHWTTRVLSPTQRTYLIRALAYSDEWIGALVDHYYEVALGRPADADGKKHWIGIIRRGEMAPAEVAAQFYASSEYFVRSGSKLTPWVDDLYVQLLRRTADTAGLTHWVDIARYYGRPTVTNPFYDSLETLRVRVDDVYLALLGRRADASGRDHWAGVLSRTKNDVRLAMSLATSGEYYQRTQER